MSRKPSYERLQIYTVLGLAIVTAIMTALPPGRSADVILIPVVCCFALSAGAQLSLLKRVEALESVARRPRPDGGVTTSAQLGAAPDERPQAGARG